VEKSKCLYSSS